ncbi:citryl-CoA lyase [Paracandidimonas soli]|uniref:citrate synthase (unknown stereospecificity) n=1 Tax=Paracandidimonas soli TaxID=1917182 RepID=A0A4R3VCW1_9BURK|nr:citryl-CoA lyase [Paracandidimonas soli]TCV01409.1 citrate synthase [Paracandidimonas soli]
MNENPAKQQAADWWSTSIIQMSPGVINFHGYPIQDLIGKAGFVEMIWLMLKSELPSQGEAALFNAALMAGVDHGPQAPSIAIARIASSCGVGINNAMASAANVLGDVHGGAGEQCVSLLRQIIALSETSELTIAQAAEEVLAAYFDDGNKYVPGYGHRFHPVDPRAAPLLGLLRKAEQEGVVRPGYVEAAEAVIDAIEARKGKKIPINIDGATAAIYGALGFEPQLCRGLFVLSRSVGILAHSWEQFQRSERNKGPIPKGWLWTYTGKPVRRSGEQES